MAVQGGRSAGWVERVLRHRSRLRVDLHEYGGGPVDRVDDREVEGSVRTDRQLRNELLLIAPVLDRRGVERDRDGFGHHDAEFVYRAEVPQPAGSVLLEQRNVAIWHGDESRDPEGRAAVARHGEGRRAEGTIGVEDAGPFEVAHIRVAGPVDLDA